MDLHYSYLLQNATNFQSFVSGLWSSKGWRMCSTGAVLLALLLGILKDESALTLLCWWSVKHLRTPVQQFSCSSCCMWLYREKQPSKWVCGRSPNPSVMLWSIPSPPGQTCLNKHIEMVWMNPGHRESKPGALMPWNLLPSGRISGRGYLCNGCQRRQEEQWTDFLVSCVWS